jgi:hypothetical protein
MAPMKGLRAVVMVAAIVVACGNNDSVNNSSTSGTPTNTTGTCADICAKIGSCGVPTCANDCPNWTLAQRLCLTSTGCDHASQCVAPTGDCTKVAVLSGVTSCATGCASASLDDASKAANGQLLCVPVPTQIGDSDSGASFQCPTDYAAESSADCRKTCTKLADCGDTFYTVCRLSSAPGAGSSLFCF